MGQCYSIILKVKFSDDAGAVKALKNKISHADSEHTDYNLNHYKELGVGTDSIGDLLKIFFGGWYAKLEDCGDGEFTSDFDCPYGWEGVMMDAFDEIAPYLHNGSYIKIYPDNGCDYGKVVDGKVVWKCK